MNVIGSDRFRTAIRSGHIGIGTHVVSFMRTWRPWFACESLSCCSILSTRRFGIDPVRSQKS